MRKRDGNILMVLGLLIEEEFEFLKEPDLAGGGGPEVNANIAKFGSLWKEGCDGVVYELAAHTVGEHDDRFAPAALFLALSRRQFGEKTLGDGAGRGDSAALVEVGEYIPEEGGDEVVDRTAQFRDGTRDDPGWCPIRAAQRFAEAVVQSREPGGCSHSNESH